ncbi:hypothetical protein COU61_03430 [Candidatus Pacearchaeota archaeon CG10_big_fil_rev_8_21_14_0_10_35_13]|nr:MAG: hypothetical protein COU61_03430 [Candidatus Pacearchaeota archaeon CG10_big_fil_rev_8_21_14_0_10_35_13]
MLSSEVVRKIEGFVFLKPRSVQEIALFIKKNWRTVDRYVKMIEDDYGTISSRTFRGGTRGALKIVYWSASEKFHSSVFQESLEKTITNFKRKEDFSAFDIYQHVDVKHKKVSVVSSEDEELINHEELISAVSSVKESLISFSGNLSWINLGSNGEIFSLLDSLIKRGVKIRVICRVDLASVDNVVRLLSLNHKYGKELVEIRHSEQPVRAFVIDNKILRIKEIMVPTGRSKELSKKVFLFYSISDKEWVCWITKVFWKLFNSSVDANKRLSELKKLRV